MSLIQETRLQVSDMDWDLGIEDDECREKVKQAVVTFVHRMQDLGAEYNEPLSDTNVYEALHPYINW